MNIVYYSVLVFVAIFYCFFILIKRIKNSKRLIKIDYSIEGRNIALGATNCKKLHKELVKLIHPDKILDERKDLADKLMQEINASKYDYNRLQILKLEVHQFLNQ